MKLQAALQSLVTALVLALVAAPLVTRGGEEAAPALPGLPLDSGHTVGEGISYGSLAVFPIYSADHLDLGDFLTLDEALAAGLAEVREIGGPASSDNQAPQINPQVIDSGNQINAAVDLPSELQQTMREPAVPILDEEFRQVLRRVGDFLVQDDAAQVPQMANPEQMAVHNQAIIQVQQVQGGSAAVNTLVIENRGDKPILVLAGTVVKGGRQDRQIGQDFVIAAHTTVPVDSFCVEHGRWNEERQGQGTGGRFGSMGVLANQKVRTAAQYEADQSEVWNQVGKVNSANAKSADTGTLAATLDDEKIRKDLDSAVGEISLKLDQVPQGFRVAGLAYAVNGKIRGARWFANNSIYLKFRPIMLRTMALDMITEDAANSRLSGLPKAPRATPELVKAFLNELAAAAERERKATAAGNENVYRENSKGYSSDCLIPEKGVKVPLTRDFMVR